MYANINNEVLQMTNKEKLIEIIKNADAEELQRIIAIFHRFGLS